MRKINFTEKENKILLQLFNEVKSKKIIEIPKKFHFLSGKIYCYATLVNQYHKILEIDTLFFNQQITDSSIYKKLF
jgi:hypothetical protein